MQMSLTDSLTGFSSGTENSKRASRSVNEKESSVQNSSTKTMDKPLTDKEIRDLRECFLLYDKVGDDHIDSSQLGDVLRGLGQNPTNAEIKKNIAELDPKGNKRISFEEFLPIFQSFRGKKNKFTSEDFVESLKMFDIDGSGMINEGELRHLLTSLGEKMTDEEVDVLIQGLEDKQGQIDCEQFIGSVLSG